MGDEPIVTETWAWSILGLFSLAGIIYSSYNITMHLLHWHKPLYQLWIVRVLLVIPLYAFISWISIQFRLLGLYLEILRDIYEAFVVYCFLIWILNVIGGVSQCSKAINNQMYMIHPWPFCWLPHVRLNESFVLTMKKFALQFIVLKPVMAFISFVLLLQGGLDLYNNEYWQYIMLILYNISYTVALYGLFYFYMACKNIIRRHSPVKKFLAVKAVIFMTYWQSLFVPAVFGSEYADKWNDAILCVEMMIFAHLHYKAFPWHEFQYQEDDVEDKNDRVRSTEDYTTISMFRSWHEKEKEDSSGSAGSHGEETIDPTQQTTTNNPPNITQQSSTTDSIVSSSILDQNTPKESLIESKDNNQEVNIEDLSVYCSYDDIKRSDVQNKVSYCTALWQVINVLDIFSDAYHSFKPNQPSLSRRLEKFKHKMTNTIANRSRNRFQLNSANDTLASEHLVMEDQLNMPSMHTNPMLLATDGIDETPPGISNRFNTINNNNNITTNTATSTTTTTTAPATTTTNSSFNSNFYVNPNYFGTTHPVEDELDNDQNFLAVLANKTKHMDLRTSNISFDMVKAQKLQNSLVVNDDDKNTNSYEKEYENGGI